MARTAISGIKIQNNGVALTAGAFGIFNLISGISAVDSGAGVAGFTGSAASGSNIATDLVTPVTSGANITLDLTTLSHPFVAIEVVFRNGQALTPTADWTRSTNTITVTGATTGDVYQIQYTY
jgi:hypothetical protein